MHIAIWQIIVLTLLAGWMIIDQLTLAIIGNYPLLVGLVTGIIMGDYKTGLAVGGTLQLMVLGVGTYGGASVPDFMTGSIIGTAFAVASGKGLSFAIGLAVPVGLLMVQLDVLARFTNTFFQHRVDKKIDEMDVKGVQRNILYGAIPWSFSRAIPVLIMLTLGNSIIKVILKDMPKWLTNGLSVAGGVLPVVGIAILLRYLPTKQFVTYLIVGFVLAAYIKVPMLGVALVGLAMAIAYYKNMEKLNEKNVVETGNNVDTKSNEVDDDDEEYED
ncbi:PTS mannose/fructose/sorbose/N-acetylgalactosamine transporter subunit IIC [Companilactobacillus halodurans]|uniref:PTS sugar transporter subunit IIC n=1 Tax=Companilactobacillus halodurans TaxID=2584183 RepID=A0A5P0ZX24_9LACO|nr:PTS sugar transporter subunit IIC [Companilactobacillus halodurans]MQS97589.1 PTS sugar transporter subunit IIC [Companilactobacillus halodurans]